MEADDDEYVRPQVSISYLQDLLLSEYKLKIISYAELNGHEDRNFHIFCEKSESMEQKSDFSQDKCESVCTRSSCNAIQTDVCSKYEYVVKVMDLVYCENFSRSERIQMQMKVQEHLLNCGFNCPKVVPSSSGSVVQRFVTSGEFLYNFIGRALLYENFYKLYIDSESSYKGFEFHQDYCINDCELLMM